MSEDLATVRQFMQTYRYTFPVLLDSGDDVAGKYNVGYLPASFFIDKDGIIQNKIVGAFRNKEEIAKYLAGIAP